MKKKYTLFAVLLAHATLAYAQEKVKKSFSPGALGSYTNVIPGYFVVDFAFNRTLGEPGDFDQEFWGSRTVNVYYKYPIRLWKSKFSVVPGIGLSMERFKFKNQYTLSSEVSDEGTHELVDVQDAYAYPAVIKSMLVTNYVDFPIGFRFDTNPESLSRSFYVILGVRVGVLYESFSKIKYRKDNEVKLARYHERYGLNIFRYGTYIRLGIAGFNLLFVYNLSPLFEEGKGPEKTNMNTFTVGISLGNL